MHSTCILLLFKHSSSWETWYRCVYTIVKIMFYISTSVHAMPCYWRLIILIHAGQPLKVKSKLFKTKMQKNSPEPPRYNYCFLKSSVCSVVYSKFDHTGVKNKALVLWLSPHRPKPKPTTVRNTELPSILKTTEVHDYDYSVCSADSTRLTSWCIPVFFEEMIDSDLSSWEHQTNLSCIWHIYLIKDQA